MDELLHHLADPSLDVAPRGARLAGSGTHRSVQQVCDGIDRIASRRREIAALEAEQLTDMLELVETCRAEGARTSPAMAALAAEVAVHDLSLAVQEAPGVVSARLSSARRVRGRLPRVWRAFRSGGMSAWHVSTIDHQLQRITEAHTAAELDEALARYACEHTAPQTRRWLARRIDQLEAAASAARARRARADRHVRLADAGDGMTWLSALLPALDAAAVMQRLDQEARTVPADDPRTHDQATADVLTGLILQGEAPPADSRSGPVRTVVGVTVPITSLMGLSEAPGELADGSASLPAALIRDHVLRPGTLFYRLLTDEHGHLLDAARIGRFAPDAVRPPLWFRDRTTTFPTSTVPAQRCDADHVEAWPAPTTGDNLQSLHRRAHRLKTGGWYTIRRRGRVWEWTTHTGHVYRRDEEPLPIEAWPEPVRAPSLSPPELDVDTG